MQNPDAPNANTRTKFDVKSGLNLLQLFGTVRPSFVNKVRFH